MAPPRFLGTTGRVLSLIVSTICTTGFLLFGYDQGVMSGIINSTPFTTFLPQLRNNSTLQGFVTAVYELGCLAGAIFILICGDWIGRRRAIMMGGATMIIGVIIQVTSMTGHTPLAQFIIGRVITGVGNGINTSSIPTYQAECSRTTNRGLLICIEGGVIAFGTLIAYWIDYGCSYGSADLSWRFPISFQIIFGLVLVFGMIGLPDSPRWLMLRDRHEEATVVIAALRGLEVDSPETKLQRALILDSIRASTTDGEKGTPFRALFTNGKTQHFRRMLLGASSQLMQQVGGCNAVIYYFPILFENITNNRNFALLMGGVNMIVYAIFATVSWFIIERAGRRKLFLWGTVGQMVSMIITFACLIPGSNSPAAKGAIVGLFTYIASFGATWLPLPWLYPAEISPIKTRAKANAVSTCTNWLFNFLIVMVTPIMITNIGWGTYLFFAAVNACFLPIIYIWYPETKMRSLEEIDIIFAKGYEEKISYVRAAKQLPRLNDEEIEQMALHYGLIDSIEENKGIKDVAAGSDFGLGDAAKGIEVRADGAQSDSSN